MPKTLYRRQTLKHHLPRLLARTMPALRALAPGAVSFELIVYTRDCDTLPTLRCYNSAVRECFRLYDKADWELAMAKHPSLEELYRLRLTRPKGQAIFEVYTFPMLTAHEILYQLGSPR